MERRAERPRRLFYFSGVSAIYKALKENPAICLRILVGLEADEFCGKLVEFEGAEISDGDSDRTRREKYLAGLKKLVRGNHLDKKAFYERWEFFVGLLKTGRLVLRKTREPNHAKLYLFSMKPEEKRANVWITGSSNLTVPGLGGQGEMNVQISDFGYAEASDYFEKLWEDAVKLTENAETKEKIIEIIGGSSSIAANVSPYEAYLLLLKNYVETRERFEKNNEDPRAVIAEPKADFSTKESKYQSFRYQIDAINQAAQIIRQHDGVIIADVVGLGKSIIGSVLARVLGGKQRRGIVIAPPGLRGEKNSRTGWWGYLYDFKLSERGNWEAMSSGNLQEVAELCENAKRDGDPVEFVIVDEAHRFRNEDTRNYEALSEICRGKKVILMTATPFGNRPRDVLSLLRLFIRNLCESDIVDGGGNLEKFFMESQRTFDDVHKCQKNLALALGAETGDDKKDSLRHWVRERLTELCSVSDLARHTENDLKKMLRERLGKEAKKIRHVVGHVMIRRNRLDLLQNPDYAPEIREKIASVRDPREQLFELSPKQNEFYDRVIKEYFGENGFTGAIYHPIDYSIYVPENKSGDDDESSGDNQQRQKQQHNMYKFMRRLLVLRFESSFSAFNETVGRILKRYEEVRRKAFVVKPGYVLISAKEVEEIDDLEDDLINENFRESADLKKMRKRGEAYSIAEDFDTDGRKRFKDDLEKDIALFKKIKSEVAELDLIANDPKAKKLVEAIRDVLAGKLGKEKSDPENRKIIIFSEYADTVNSVAKKLKAEADFGKRVLHVEELTGSVRETILKNFDAGCGVQEDKFDVLISTDKISEGFNLNRAGVVVNYDIPWNPVRVIQRVGRINRIGKKVFENLFIFNFFPTEQGAKIARQREIVERKMLMIHEAIGEDAKIFAEDEEPSASELYQRMKKNPENDEPESDFTKFKKIWEEAKKEHPEIVAKIEKFPLRVKTCWAKKDGRTPRTVLFSRRGNALFANSLETADDGTKKTPETVLVEDAINDVACTPETPKAKALSENFWKRYEILQKTDTGTQNLPRGNSKSPVEKARNILNAALSGQNCGAFADFANEIVEDINRRRTLPEFTLREIAKAGEHPEDFERFLGALKARIGSLKYDKEKTPVERLIAEDLQ